MITARILAGVTVVVLTRAWGRMLAQAVEKGCLGLPGSLFRFPVHFVIRSLSRCLLRSPLRSAFCVPSVLLDFAFPFRSLLHSLLCCLSRPFRFSLSVSSCFRVPSCVPVCITHYIPHTLRSNTGLNESTETLPK